MSDPISNADGDDFDISSFKTLATADMVVNHPITGVPTKWVITFAGPGHAQTIALADLQARRSLVEERKRVSAQVNGRKYKPDDVSPDEKRDEIVHDVVERIVTWTPVKLDGEVTEFSKPRAVALLRDPAYGKLFEQIIEFLAAERSFMPRSA